MSKSRHITLAIKFTTKFTIPPSVRVVSPKGVTVEKVTAEKVILKAKIKDVTAIYTYLVKLSINNKESEDTVFQLQFCPACKRLLNGWMVVNLRDTTNRVTITMHCCPTCGCMFIPKQMMMQMIQEQQKGIVIPGTRDINRFKN